MSQSFAQMLAGVRAFHEKHDFAGNNGHDMAYRLLLTMEELGELAECITKGKPQADRADELADLLILTLGHAIAMDLDLEAAFDATLEEVEADIALGGTIEIEATPTFIINGVKIKGGLQPQFFDVAIALELERAAGLGSQ